MADPDPATALIEAIREGLPVGVELDEREETLLNLAAGQARDVERAEADLEERGYLVPGSQGQQVINPSLGEARQGRIAIGRLLGQIDLPDSTRDAVKRAGHAADERWARAS